jgi:hypothetical protein
MGTLRDLKIRRWRHRVGSTPTRPTDIFGEEIWQKACNNCFVKQVYKILHFIAWGLLYGNVL